MAQASKRFAFAAAIALLASTTAVAGRVHPDLEARLAKLAPDELLPVIVVLEEQANVGQASAHLPRNDRHGRGRAVVEALRATTQRGQGPVLGTLGSEQAQGRVRDVRPFWIFNGVAATAKEAAIRRLAAHKDVREVRFDAPIPAPRPRPAAVASPAVSTESAWNITQIRAPDVWAIAPGYDGTGIVVGSFDTGVDGTHPDLAPRYRGNHAISWFDPYHQHSTPFDNNGHGTHTTGTMVAGAASGYNLGVAPGARWIAAKGWNDRDDATVSAFHQIFEWFLAPGGDPANAPHVVNNSWGQSPPDCYGDFLLDVRALRAAGIFPAFASGNEGPDASTALGPGNLTEAFSVGATDFDDAVADFSSRGPSQCDGAIKPDISAPGVAILSTLPDDFYYELDGTSMATPHISGAAAVLLSIDPGLSVDELESALVLGAVDVGAAGPDNDTGVGRLDLLVSASIVLGVPRVGVAATIPTAYEAGELAGRFTVTRSEPLADPLTVTYSVAGTATAGSDYTALSGTVTFPAGVASVHIPLLPVDDVVVELDETVVVTLSPDPAFLLAPATASVRIVSDELLPDLAISAFGAPGAGGAGLALTVTDTTRNAGPGSAGASTTRYYLSLDSAFDASDVSLGSRSVPILAAGASNSGSASITIPAGTASGAYFLIARADGDATLLEISETNNGLQRPISIGADLAMTTLVVPGIGGAGLPLVVSDTITNQGGSPAAASTATFYLSSDTVLDASDVALGSRAVPALAPGATSSATTSVTVPAGTATGTWYVFARADSAGVVGEVSETNNATYRSTVIGPDLIINAFSAPATSGAGVAFGITETTRNTGGGASPPTTTRFYLSTDTVVDAGDVVLAARAVGALAPNASDSGTLTLTIPAGTPGGAYYLIAKADGGDTLAETSELNNAFWRPLALGADLQLTSLTVPGVAGAGLAIAVSDTTSNTGGSGAAASTTTFYLSSNSTLDAADVALGSRAVPALAAGASSSGTVSLAIPPGTAAGTYYLVARADAADAVVETSEANNLNNRSLVIGPDLIVNAFTAPSSAAAGGTLVVSDTIRNSGGGAATASVTRYYLSTNATLEAGDIMLGSRAVVALAPNASDTGSATLAIPAGTGTGAYYLIAKADGDDALAETQELNNQFYRPLAIGADLVIASLTVPGVGGAGLALAVSDTTTNQGGSAAAASTTTYYLSADSVFDAGDTVLGARPVPALAAGGSHTGSVALVIPAATAMGTYYVFARADSAEAVPETTESNNVTSRTVLVGPDLTVIAFTAPATGGAGGSLTVSDTTRNIGGGATPPSVTRYYLSTNALFDAGDVAVGARNVASLAPNASDSGPATLTIPVDTASGAYFLIARSDGADAIVETQETNNGLVRGIVIGSDLVLANFTVPSLAGAGTSITVTDTVSNQGGSASVASTVTYYLSANTLLDAADVAIGSRELPAIAGGASNSGSGSVALPAVAAGAYYIIARADSGDVVVETSETNNTLARAVAIGPDLAISAFSAPSAAGAGAALAVTDSTRNIGGGASPASVTRYYLSTDSLFDAGDVMIGSRNVAALAANGTDTATSSVTIPAGTAMGAYYLIARADGDAAIGETQEGNNTAYRTINIGADLVITAMAVPGVGGAGLAINVTDTVTNLGGNAAPASTITFYLSVNATLDAGDVVLGSRGVAALAPGASDSGTSSLLVPAATAMGLYYVFARADSGDAVLETSEANNTNNRTVVIGPDLVVNAFGAASSVAAGATLAITDAIRNSGGGAAPATNARYYLSTNPGVDAGDLILGTRVVPALAPGTLDSGALGLVIPAGTAPGTYYLIAKADGDDLLAETQETNNAFWRPLTVLAP